MQRADAVVALLDALEGAPDDPPMRVYYCFYQMHALGTWVPDTRDRPGALITYIAQESMLPDAPSAPFRHPMTAELFTGFEPSTGRHVPSAKLRSRYPLAERGL